MNTPHFVFLSTNKKVTGVWNSEVGSKKSMEKAEDIQFHLWISRLWNTNFYIFTAVKYSFFIYALYLINNILYFNK